MLYFVNNSKNEVNVVNNTHNVLTDEESAYTFTPREISPVSDDPCNPDCIYFYKPMEPGTVHSVCAVPEEAGRYGEDY